MRLKVITPPTLDPQSLADAKAHMGVTTATDDTLIYRLLSTAFAHLEGERGSLGRCLRPTVYQMSLSAFLDEIAIPLPPTRAVEAVTYVDALGMPRVMELDLYRVGGLGSDDGAIIVRKLGTAWPATAGGPEAVQIRFTAGYDDIPSPLMSAVMMHVAHLYENREATLVGVTGQSTPLGYDDLVQPYAQWAC